MKMTTNFNIVQKLMLLGKDLGNILTSTDLYNIIGADNPLTNKIKIRNLIQDNIIIKAKRGLYALPGFDLWRLADQVKSQSYISMISVLAKNGLIGTSPDNSAFVVCLGLQKNITILNKRINFYTIQKDLFFGFTTDKNGVRIADSEKAYLDLLYYHLRGYKFIIDPLSEVRIELLNQKKINLYLKKYKNPKFITFVKGVLYGKQ